MLFLHPSGLTVLYLFWGYGNSLTYLSSFPLLTQALPPVKEVFTFATTKEEWNWKDKYPAATPTPAVVLADCRSLNEATPGQTTQSTWKENTNNSLGGTFMTHLNLKPKKMQSYFSAVTLTRSNHISSPKVLYDLFHKQKSMCPKQSPTSYFYLPNFLGYYCGKTEMKGFSHLFSLTFPIKCVYFCC